MFTEDGPAYGRKIITLLLQKREQIPLYLWYIHNRAQRKTSATRVFNLIPYRADYFDNKLYIDQNEKLVARPLCAFYVKAFNL